MALRLWLQKGDPSHSGEAEEGGEQLEPEGARAERAGTEAEGAGEESGTSV